MGATPKVPPILALRGELGPIEDASRNSPHRDLGSLGAITSEGVPRESLWEPLWVRW